jgi:hypothetical protein
VAITGVMKRNRGFDDAEIEALLAGRKPADRPDLDDLVEFIRTAKAVSHQAPSPDVERRHLSAIVAATAEAPIELSRRRNMKSLIASRWTKIAAATVIAFGTTSGLAAANVLPAAAQNALAAAAEKVGFDLPRSSEKAHHNDDDSDGTSDTEDGTEEGDTNDAGTAGEENGKSVADDVHAVLEDDSLEGREKGDAVSDAASQNRQNETHSHSRVGNPSPSPDGGPPAELPGGNPND